MSKSYTIPDDDTRCSPTPAGPRSTAGLVSAASRDDDEDVKTLALGGLAVVAVLAVGWAVSTAIDAGDRADRRPDRTHPSSSARDHAGRTRSSPREGESARRAEEIDAPSEPTDPPSAAPPASENPGSSAPEGKRRGEDDPRGRREALAEARREADVLLRELEAQIAIGDPMTHEAWVESYRRGNEAITGIVKLTDRDDPEEVADLDRTQTVLRQRLRELQPGP